MAELYRKSSIEKLSNPEQLDRAIVVTSPMSWMALIGVAIIIVVTIVWSIVGTLPTVQNVNGVIASPEGTCAFYTDKAGVITKVIKKAGDSVKKDETIAEIKTNDGKKYSIKADMDGKISENLVEIESKVYVGAEIARYTPQKTNEQVVVCYVPLALAKQLETDMKVLIYPTSVDAQKYGHMEGNIEVISTYPVSTNNMWYVLGADNLVAEQFLSQGPIISILCSIKEESNNKNGYYWTSKKGGDLVVSNSTFVSAKIVTDESAPITKLLKNLKEKLED